MSHATLELRPLAQIEPVLEYKPCACFGKSPTRACRHCFSTGWLKLCKECFGQGILTKQVRQANAQGRTERCGFCMGAGWTPCPKAEVARAEELSGEASVQAPMAPSLTATQKRLATRRRNMEAAKKTPLKKTPRGISISADRPQNPLEAMELVDPADAADVADGAADVADPAEVAPSSFAPEE